MTPHRNHRSRFFHTISVIHSSHPLRVARLDFFGSVVLVCAIGLLAKLVQTLLAH
jgi:hypothetical protein